MTSQYKDGTWHELRRDLDADLRSVFGVGLEQVLWFCIRGNYDLDGLTLIGREECSYEPREHWSRRSLLI